MKKYYLDGGFHPPYEFVVIVGWENPTTKDNFIVGWKHSTKKG